MPGGEEVASSHQSLSCSPPSNQCFVKEASFASNVVRGEGEGDLFVRLQKDDLEKCGGVSATIAGLVKAGDCFHYENRGRVAGWS